MKAVSEFQSELLVILDEIGPEARDRFIERLRERRVLRRAITVE